MSDTIDEKGWPVRTPRYIIENPVQDLLNKEIDYSVNILGNLWLERGSYGIIQGTSGIGKSVVAMQIAALTAMGRDVFGIKVDAPLKVLVVQAEDSQNDRKQQVTGILNNLDVTEQEMQLVHDNMRIVTPENRADRGDTLFEWLRSAFPNKLDLIIFNPAFAFVDGSLSGAEPVGDFLRNHLQGYCRYKNAAALVIHHVPKPPRKGKGRDADTTMCSSFGSAEWAQAPRGSITIDRTMSSWVYEFTVGKRGDKCGWRANRNGDYRRYFVHNRTGRLFWDVATEADIAAANNGIGEEDFAEVFKGDTDLNLETIARRFRHYQHDFQGEELTALLENLVTRGRLTTKEIDGEQTWKAVRRQGQGETQAQRMAHVLFYIEEAGDAGIITSKLRDAVSFGHTLLKDALDALESEGKIYKRKEGSNTIRYFLTGGLIAGLQNAAASQSCRRLAGL